MGTVDRGIYLPTAGEVGWADEVNDNFSRLADLGVNVKAYGAIGDGVTNDQAATQNAINALGSNGGTVFFPIGTYQLTTTGLTLPGNVILQGASRTATIIRASGANVVTIAGHSWGIRDLTLRAQQPGGGHVLTQSASTSQGHLYECDLYQENAAKSIYDNAGFTVNDCSFSHSYIKHVTTSSVPSFEVTGAGSGFNQNRFFEMRVQDNGSYFFFFDNTDANFHYGNEFRNITFENPIGGAIRLNSATMALIENCGVYDLTATTTADLFYIGKSTGNNSNACRLANVRRVGGTLGGGLNNIKVQNGSSQITIENHTGSSVVADLDNTRTTVINGDPANYANKTGAVFLNNASGLTLMDAAKGIELGSGLIKIVSGANTPEGAITAPVGSLFLRTNGGANTTLYVKESGAGNTGWVAK